METLKNYGVQEMNMKEMKEVDGGNWIIIAGIIILLIASLIVASQSE